VNWRGKGQRAGANKPSAIHNILINLRTLESFYLKNNFNAVA